MKNICLLFLVIFCQYLPAQEQLGLKLENYAGINGVTLNPASNLSNPLRFDFNLISAGFFVENNYLFIENTNSGDLLKNGSGSNFYNAPDFSENNLPNDGYIIDYFNDSRKRHAAVLTNIMGPSVAFKIGEQHSVGLFTAIRQHFSAQKIPTEFSYYRYDQFPLLEEFRVDPFVGALISWSEIGLNYAYQIPTATGSLGIGVNLRYLQGYEAFYFRNDRTAGYIKEGGSVVTFGSPQVSFGFTKSNLDYNNISFEKNGSGWATDIGATLTFDEDDEGYNFKIGASFTDFGYINFNKNTENHRVSLDTQVNIDGDAYDNLSEGEEVEQATAIFSSQVLGSPTASFQDDRFRAVLPAAFSVQADYRVMPGFFVNGTLIQRMPFSGIIPKRSNLFAVTPRFEHRWFSASLPLVLYNWQDFRVGLAARLGYLIIGSDNLGSWVGKKDFTGTDIYAGLKINFSEINFGGGKSGSRKRRRGPKVKCYF